MNFGYYNPGWIVYPQLLLSPPSHATQNLIQPVQQQQTQTQTQTHHHQNHHPDQLNQPIRKPYHPPSSAKSHYCIWVGNVPPDSSVEELFSYFSRQSAHAPRLSLGEYAALPPNCGLVSIHLISKSRCCFANFSTPHALHLAVRDLNGSKLRLGAPRLVVRVRDMHSELSSGVGLQRGRKLHRNWVNWASDRNCEQVQNSETQQQQEDNNQDNERQVDNDQPKLSRSSSVSSTCTSSTTDSFLSHHFPVRYFILKSHHFDDLLESVKTGVWSTQPHNEHVLEKAFRSSHTVILIFSINRSGGWFGHAKMSSQLSNSSFSLQWNTVQFLPFSHTRLRNPFNSNREVKVSRDGTEIEPDVGRQLVELWNTAPIEQA